MFVIKATSRGFRRIVVLTVMKLVEGNLTHGNLEHLMEDITLIRIKISIDFFEDVETTWKV